VFWAKCPPENDQNGGTVRPVANLMTDSESRNPNFYSRFIVGLTIALSRLVSEIRVDTQTDGLTDRQRRPLRQRAHTVVGQLIRGRRRSHAIKDCVQRRQTDRDRDNKSINGPQQAPASLSVSLSLSLSLSVSLLSSYSVCVPVRVRIDQRRILYLTKTR